MTNIQIQATPTERKIRYAVVGLGWFAQAAAKENHIKLMIAYRLHLDAANMEAVEVVKSGQIGEPRFFNSIFAQQTEQNNSRMKAVSGGGTIEDIGIYCINAARYIFQAEPISVFATSASKDEERFRDSRNE